MAEAGVSSETLFITQRVQHHQSVQATRAKTTRATTVDTAYAPPWCPHARATLLAAIRGGDRGGQWLLLPGVEVLTPMLTRTCMRACAVGRCFEVVLVDYLAVP